MFPNHILKSDVQQLPLIRFGGKIHVVDNLNKLRGALDIIGKESILGFDTETKPTFVKGDYNHTALVQFATMEEAFLIRINQIGIPDMLKSILENKNILKIGVSLRDDIKDLKRVSSFKPHGFIDLNNVAKELGITQIGIKSLTGIFLQKRISKGQQTSNWENKHLSRAQQGYAATDAWICMKMYDSLLQRGYVNAS